MMKLGGPRPLHGSSVGKLLAAFNSDLESRVLSTARLEPFTPLTLTDHDRLRDEYDAIRRRGYSVNDGESVEGIIGLSTPIVGAGGGVDAAVHISAPRGRLGPDRLPVVVAAMQAAGARISADLGAPLDAVRVLT
ncbi:MAG: IclR family transcriptional regulator C-terminal domain-containing protein, partial [Nakamurella sp.]